MYLIYKHFFKVRGSSLYLLMVCMLVISPLSQAYKLDKLASGLDIPWGMAFVSSDQLLITEKRGQLQLLELSSGHLRALNAQITVNADGQGGLLDVVTPPDYQPGGWIYFTYSRAAPNKTNQVVETCLARARLSLKRLRLYDWQELFVSRSGSTTGRHFGSRVAFDDKHHVFFSVGDRGDRDNGQNRLTHAGSIIRLNLDGTVPEDNPFIQDKNALDEIWSYGHRNPQGLAWDNNYKRLWAIEHGPRGGDELNLILQGKNYGWARVSHGKEYWGPIAVGEATSLPGMQDPHKVYTPSIAPGSLMLYSGKVFKQWQGQLFSGALKLQHLNILELNAMGTVVSEKRLLAGLKQRIRALIEGPDGSIYFSTDSGDIYRLSADI